MANPPPLERDALVALARESMGALRDEARDFGRMPFKVRDRHVMAIVRALDALLAGASGGAGEAQEGGEWQSIERLEQWSSETQGSWRLTRVTNTGHALAPFGVGFGVELMTTDGVRAFEKSGKGRPLDGAVSAAFTRVGYEPAPAPVREPVSMPADRSALIAKAAEMDDSCISAGLPEPPAERAAGEVDTEAPLWADCDEAMASLGLTREATLSAVQRRLRVDAAIGMRLLAFREAFAALRRVSASPPAPGQGETPPQARGEETR